MTSTFLLLRFLAGDTPKQTGSGCNRVQQTVTLNAFNRQSWAGNSG
jgi:hypothetical protein